MTERRVRVGVIDLLTPRWMTALVPHLEALGYSRYWTTEHHTPEQSANPTLMAALAAGKSSGRLRVGTAGVLLNFCSPLKVAEDFRLLELMFPGRIDLGVAGGLAIDRPLFHALLDGRPEPTPESYARKVRALVRLVRGARGEPEDISPTSFGPHVEGSPTLWLCGTSERSAVLAGELGMSYSFHDYLAINGGPFTKKNRGKKVISAYKNAFKPNRNLRKAQFNIVCYGICASTSRQARELWQTFRFGSEPKPRPKRAAAAAPMFAPSFCGTPQECKRQLEAIRRVYGAEEIIVQSLANGLGFCMTSYELLAEALRLRPE